jgi:thioredoxin 1
MGKLLFDLRDSSQENVFHFLTQNAGLCVVDFYADWCGPCKKLGAELEHTLPSQKKIFDNLLASTENELTKNDVSDKVVFVKVNIDNFENLANQYKVQSIPHVIYYRNGKLQNVISRNCGQIYDSVSTMLQ